MATIFIQRRYQGPPQSGNGGYVCGCLSSYIEGTATVRLRQPPPLETVLEVHLHDSQVNLMLGEEIVAQARPTTLSLELPVPPSLAEANTASQSYRGFQSHPFPNCFVCGPARLAGDGLRLFAGPVPGKAMVAGPWEPDASLADDQGNVRREFLWAALDCPGAFTFVWPPGGAVLLGEMTAAIDGPVEIGKTYMVVGWEMRHKGRRHESGTALFDASGVCLGKARATWFEVAATP